MVDEKIWDIHISIRTHIHNDEKKKTEDFFSRVTLISMSIDFLSEQFLIYAV